MSVITPVECHEGNDRNWQSLDYAAEVRDVTDASAVLIGQE